MRPQSVLTAMNNIQNSGAPAPQSSLPPLPQAGPITGAKATPLGAEAMDPGSMQLPAWKNYIAEDMGAVKLPTPRKLSDKPPGVSNAQ